MQNRSDGRTRNPLCETVVDASHVSDVIMRVRVDDSPVTTQIEPFATVFFERDGTEVGPAVVDASERPR